MRILSGIWGSKGGLLIVVNGECSVLIWGIDSCVIFGLSAVLDAATTCLGERGCCGSCNGVCIEFEPIEDEMMDDISMEFGGGEFNNGGFGHDGDYDIDDNTRLKLTATTTSQSKY